MKRIVTLILLIVCALLKPQSSQAKPADIIDSMNTEAFWHNITFHDYANRNTEALPKADTMFVVASNRALQFGQTRFMSEQRGEDNISYFLVFLKNGRWNVWHTSFEHAIAAMNHADRDWVVYTEGYGKIFTTGLYRAFSMTEQHGVNVLYLDYPSYNTAKKIMGNYYFAQKNARQSAEDFAPIFDTLKHYREAGKMGRGNLTLFFHSMGNNMIRQMVREERIATINDRKWVDNLVLNSACVPQKNHAKWVDQLHFASRIYINYNPKDATLSGANFMSLKKQLGQRQKSPRSKQAIYVKFDGLCNHNHSNFLQLVARKPVSNAAIVYYNTLFHGKSITLNDDRCFRNNNNGSEDYTILDADIMPPTATAESTIKTENHSIETGGNTSTLLR